MPDAKTALLSDRGVVRVDGSDAEKLLQGLVTNDVELSASRRSVYAALLTPQGKVLFDFLITRHGGGYLLDTAADKTAELVKRLQMYRLRSRVDITDASHSVSRYTRSGMLDRNGASIFKTTCLIRVCPISACV